MKDIAPDLYEKVHADFIARAEKDRTVRKIRYKASKGEADYIDAYEYGKALSECLVKAFRLIKAEELPDGKMYFNIAERVVRPLLEELEDNMRELSRQVQDGLNEKAGLGLKSV